MKHTSRFHCFTFIILIALFYSSPILFSNMKKGTSNDFTEIFQIDPNNTLKNSTEIPKKPLFQSFLQTFFGSGLAIALFSGIYIWLVKGRIKIENFCDIHADDKRERFRIKVKNKRFKTLKNLCCYITFIGLRPNDLSIQKYSKKYIISRYNFVPIKMLYLNWGIGEKAIDLHPKQLTELNVLIYLKKSKEIEIASEFGYKQPRAKIVNIRELLGYIQFFADDFKSPKFYFKISPDSKNNRIALTRIKKTELKNK